MDQDAEVVGLNGAAVVFRHSRCIQSLSRLESLLICLHLDTNTKLRNEDRIESLGEGVVRIVFDSSGLSSSLRLNFQTK